MGKFISLNAELTLQADPALLPTDVQKVTAVDNPALKDFMDVIVFPTQGPVALCSLLGGGDYDGDTVKVIWDSAIVSSFQNAPQSMAFAPDDLEEVWIDARHGYMTDDDCSFDKREASEESSTQISALLSSTLFTPKQFGMLANMHTTAAYGKRGKIKASLSLSLTFKQRKDWATTTPVFWPICLPSHLTAQRVASTSNLQK